MSYPQMRPPRRPAFLQGTSPKAPQGAFGHKGGHGGGGQGGGGGGGGAGPLGGQPIMRVVPFLSPALEGLPEPLMDPLPPPPPRPVPAAPPPPTFPPELAARLWEVIHALRAEAVSVREQMVEDTVELACMVASHLLSREIGGNREELHRLVQAAIERLPDPRHVTVRLSPADAELLRRQAPPDMDEPSLGGTNTVVEIVADARMSPGDVDVEADEGSVDARLATRLESVRHAFLEAFQTRPSGEEGS